MPTGQNRLLRVTRWPLHNPRVSLPYSQGQCREYVRDQVEEKNLKRLDGQRYIDQRCEKNHRNLADVARDEVEHEFADVAEDDPTLLNRDHDGREGIIFEYHIRCLARHLSAALPHGDADVGLFEGRCIVHAVTRHGHDGTIPLMQSDQVQLLFGADPC